MRRRNFIFGVGGAAIAWPLAVRAQPTKMYRLGVLAISRDLPHQWQGLLQGLRDHGYIDGRNLSIEWRYAEGQADRWPALAHDLAVSKVDAIVVNTTPAALAAKAATATIPIVITGALDPVGTGLAASLAKPGGNVTGIGLLDPEVSAKGLTLLKEAVPGLGRVAVLWNAANPANAPIWRRLEATARAVGIELRAEQVNNAQDLDNAIAAVARKPPDALMVIEDALLGQYQSRIVDFAMQTHLPAISQFGTFAERGGLMSYGPNLFDAYRLAAGYVDKVLRGANPADLPFAQPTTFDLIVNVKTAKAFGIKIPGSLLARADEVIE